MFEESPHPYPVPTIILPPLLAPMPPSPPLLQSLADLPQDEKDKVQRIVDKVVSLGHENDELRQQIQRDTEQHADQLMQLTGKLQTTTGLLYLYQSTLESKISIDSGSEYESLLRGKQRIIDELQNKLEEADGELVRTTAQLLSRELEMENLAKQQQQDHNVLQDSMERCSRMETACLSLTKQLTTQGFRLRHMQAMVVKEQQRTTTALLNDKAANNRMCHVATQCVDIIEQRNAVVGTAVAATIDADSTGPHDGSPTTSSSSSSLHNKKVVVRERSNHKDINNDIASERDAVAKGKRTRTCKVLTMTGLVKVPASLSTMKQPQQIKLPTPSPLSTRGDDKVAVQSPKKQKKQASGNSSIHQQRWKDDDDDDNTEPAVSSRGGEISTRSTSSSSSSNSMNISSNAEYANHHSHSHNHPQYTSNSKDKHRVVFVTTAAVRRRPATTTPRTETEGMLGFPHRRRPFDDIENNIYANTTVSTRAALSLPSSEQQATNRKILSRTITGSNSKTTTNIERQSPLHSSRVMFDGDYDAQLFVLLDNIEEQIL